MEPADPVRAHGFEPPLHPLQLLSWIVFGADVLSFSIFGLPMLSSVSSRVTVSILYFMSAVACVAATVCATACDPADPLLREKKTVQAEELHMDTDSHDLLFCDLCELLVGARSKHCRTCNKCVSCFDHHCMWLNSCVGERNYTAFFILVTSVAVKLGIVLCCVGYLILEFVASSLEFESRAQDTYNMPVEFVVFMHVTSFIFNLPLFLLDLQLVVFHLYLAHQGLTTYDYIRAAEGSSVLDNFKALPRCMDWIVFSRCGRRRRRRQKTAEEKAGDEHTMPPEEEGVDVASEAAAAGLPSEACTDGSAADAIMDSGSYTLPDSFATPPGTVGDELHFDITAGDVEAPRHESSASGVDTDIADLSSDPWLLLEA